MKTSYSTIQQFILIIAMLFCAQSFAAQTEQMSQQQLLTAMKNTPMDIVLLDVRSHDEFNQGHIAGAINISHETINENLAKLNQYKEKTVVVYCRSGRRAGIAEQVLAQNGYNKLFHLTGDMNGWLEAKLPVVRNK